MALSTAFQRNAFQNNAFQIRRDDIGGVIVAHRSGTPFTKKRYRKIIDEIEAAAEAGRRTAELKAAQEKEAARKSEDVARAKRKAAREAEDQANAERARQRAAEAALRSLVGMQGMAAELRRVQLMGLAARAAQRQREAAQREEAAAIALLLQAEEENMKRLREQARAIIRRLLS
jgi:hypothetical protein